MNDIATATSILDTLHLPDPETAADLIRMAERQGHPLTNVRLFVLNREAMRPNLLALLMSGKCWTGATRDNGHLFALLPRERAVFVCHRLNAPASSKAEFAEAMAADTPPDALRLLIVETTAQGEQVSTHINWGTIRGVRTPRGPADAICVVGKGVN